MSNTISLGGQTALNVSMLSMTPLSSTHSLLHLSARTLNTDTSPEQLGRGDVTRSPLDASLCHSQFGYACEFFRDSNFERFFLILFLSPHSVCVPATTATYACRTSRPLGFAVSTQEWPDSR